MLALENAISNTASQTGFCQVGKWPTRRRAMAYSWQLIAHVTRPDGRGRDCLCFFFLHVVPEPLGACDALRGLLDNAIHGDAAQFDHCLRQETYHLRLVMSVERFLKQPNKFHCKSAFQTEEERTFTNDMLTFLLNLEQRNKHAHGEGCSQYIARLRALSEAWNSGFFHTACVVVRRHSSCAQIVPDLLASRTMGFRKS